MTNIIVALDYFVGTTSYLHYPGPKPGYTSTTPVGRGSPVRKDRVCLSKNLN